ncbi:MAG: TonB-dependent receptor [Tepidisphaeraceae bacterium]
MAQTAPTTQPTVAAAAVPSTQPSAANSAGAVALPTVVVIGRAEDLVGVADTSNQGYVGHEDIESRPLLRPAEVLEAVPGLVITQHSGDGKANQYFLRGFQLDHGTDFSVSLDGVPQNLPTHAHGQGYLDLNDLIPELVDNIDYRKGPYYGNVGDFSAAGSADIHYVDSLPQGFASFTGGSYGYERGLVADSLSVGNGNVLGAIEYFHENGPWDVPEDYQRINGLVKYSEGNVLQGWSVESLDMHGRWNATNQVADAAIDEGIIGRYGSLSPSDGGDTERYTVAAEGHEKNAQGETNVEGYAAWYDMQLWNDFTYYLNNPVLGDQFEQQDQRLYGGLHAEHTFNGTAFGRTSDTTIGTQLRSDDIHPSLYDTDDRDIYATVETDHVVESTAGAYIENRTEWTDKFRTEGSLRGDYFNFHVHSDLPDDSGNPSAAIFSPKLNLVFGPWDKTEFYISGGYGFHSNDARSIVSTVAPDQGAPETLLPATRARALTQARGAETGVRTGILPGLQSTLSFFVLNLKSEQVFDGDTAESVPSGPTQRIGFESGNFYSVTPWLTLDGDYSLSQARFTDHEPAGDYVPESIESVLQSGITVHDLPGLKGLFGAIRVRYFGPRALTQDDSVQSNSSTLLNAELGYEFNDHLTLKADFLNVGNVQTDDIEYYYQYQLKGQSPMNGVVIHPAEPFEARFTLTYTF